MPIIKNTILRGSDGNDYIYLGALWQNIRTRAMGSRRMQIELDRVAIQRKLVEGDGIFQELLDRSISYGYIPEQTRLAREWMQREARGSIVGRSGSTMRSELLTESSLSSISVSRIRVGRPVMFMYDAKGKKDLPYFDQFPVIVPISVGVGRFIGLNLHYLDYRRRAILLDGLYRVRESDNRFAIDYSKLMKGISRFPGFKPTIHSYLRGHIRSRVVEISPIGWTLCFFLPVAHFNNGVDQRRVWRDSEVKINSERRK